VGKTSFVNACQYFSYTGISPIDLQFPLLRVLPCFEKIQLSEDDDLLSFVTKTLISVTNSIRTITDETGVSLKGDVRDIVDCYQSISVKTGKVRRA